MKCGKEPACFIFFIFAIYRAGDDDVYQQGLTFFVVSGMFSIVVTEH